MLAAMGYQQGQGLGKRQSGRAAPVSVQFKAGKHGLGVEENKKRKEQQIECQQQDRGKLQQFSSRSHQPFTAEVSCPERQQRVNRQTACSCHIYTIGHAHKHVSCPCTRTPGKCILPLNSLLKAANAGDNACLKKHEHSEELGWPHQNMLLDCVFSQGIWEISLSCPPCVWHAVVKRARVQQEMQAEHKVTSAVRAANRRAESQLLQARQVSDTNHGYL